MLAHSFRDCEAWNAEKLRMSSASNEACKLYDASLSQYVNWYEDKTLGGIESTISRMLKADHNFVLGHVLNNGLSLIGASMGSNLRAYEQNVTIMSDLAEKQSEKLSKREKNHVKAIELLLKEEVERACELWEEILIEHPNDIMALRFAHDVYFYIGKHEQIKDSASRVLPLWKPSQPLYSAVYAMQSFGLAQTNLFKEAEIAAQKALDLNINDGLI